VKNISTFMDFVGSCLAFSFSQNRCAFLL